MQIVGGRGPTVTDANPSDVSLTEVFSRILLLAAPKSTGL